MKQYNADKSLNDISYHVAKLSKSIEELTNVLDNQLENINNNIKNNNK